MARQHVHKLGERGLYGRGLKVEISTAELGRFGLPLPQQLTDYQQIELTNGSEFKHRRAIESGSGLGAEVLVAEPGGQAAAVLRALGGAIFVVHKKAGFRWPKLGTNGPVND